MNPNPLNFTLAEQQMLAAANQRTADLAWAILLALAAWFVLIAAMWLLRQALDNLPNLRLFLVNRAHRANQRCRPIAARRGTLKSSGAMEPLPGSTNTRATAFKR